MNIITKDMNNMKNNVESIVANIMKDTRELTKALPSNALDMIRNPSGACLPLDLTSLLCLKYGGPLR
jgi:hypothetical protein